MREVQDSVPGTRNRNRQIGKHEMSKQIPAEFSKLIVRFFIFLPLLRPVSLACFPKGFILNINTQLMSLLYTLLSGQLHLLNDTNYKLSMPSQNI